MLNQQDFVIAALLESGTLSRSGVEQATAHASEHSVEITEAVVALGMVTSRDIAIVRAETSDYPFVHLADYDVNYGNTALLPRAAAESLGAFPLFVMQDQVTVAMANPLDLRAVDQLRALLKAEVDPVICESEALRALINRAYSLTGEQAKPGSAAGSAATSAALAELTTGKEPIVAAVNQILAQGMDLGASDIHLGPDEHELHLRYRVDGTLRPHQGPSLAAHPGLIQRLKVMASLDLTQTRRPQDGKFRYTYNGRHYDLRLSIIPTVCGENAVLRILASGANIKDLPSLGFPASDLAYLEEVIESPYGMILVTGPTGSGKTTTLYTALKRLNNPDTNIITIEDPVEVRLPLIRQVQVNTEIGMTFAGALRSVLRQDPDVVFVGEIRDEETARISVQAALTGHLVLSSLHTNDAAGAIPRLRDLGCPSFAVNAALLAVVAQRLVRRCCPECARPNQPAPNLLERFGIKPGEDAFVKGSGCSRCSSSGYRGRMGVYEVLRMTPAVRKCIDQGAGTSEVRETAITDGMRLMWRDGVNKARLGLTTLEELSNVVAVQATEGEEKGKGAVVKLAA